MRRSIGRWRTGGLSAVVLAAGARLVRLRRAFESHQHAEHDETVLAAISILSPQFDGRDVVPFAD